MSTSKKVCFSFNYAPHYREEIYLMMDHEFDCDFYFGSRALGSTQIKKIPYSKFTNLVVELKFLKVFGKFYRLKGQSKLASKPYSTYVITGQLYNLSAWFLLIKNKMRGKKSYIWNHGSYGKESFLKNFLMKIQFYLIEGYFVYGNYAKKQMVDKGYKKRKLHVIYNSLNYSMTLKLRSKLFRTDIYKKYFKNTQPTVVFIGRLTKIKKLDLLLKAQMNAIENNFNLVIIGDGDESTRLKLLVKKNNLTSKVWFYGTCYDEVKISELIYNADICVSPGNIGLTAIHTLSYGTPAITHNNYFSQMPEYEAITEGLTGSFFKENDVSSLNKCISKWLENHPIKDKELIESCYAVIDSSYNPHNQIELLKKVLN